jgi:hypothetical protein
MTIRHTCSLMALLLASPFAIAAAPATSSTGAPGAVPAATPPAAGANPSTITVSVSNPLVAARAKETIAIAIAELAKLAPGFDAKKSVVTTADGKEILSQLVDMTGDETPDEIVFQADFGAKETKRFKVKTGDRRPAPRDEYRAYGRFVRERYDDFAWENDLVAHRMYGPALETHPKEALVSSGVDVWVKRVSKVVINDWFMTGDYHADSGEGADFYGVGKSRGLGGTGVWTGGKLAVSRNFVSSRVLANGPIRLVFELTYAPWEAGSVNVGETKRVTLDAGTQFNRFESTFTGQKGNLKVGIGIAKHPGSVIKVDARSGAMRAWEPLDNGHAGNLGTAILLPAGSKLEAHHNDLDYLVVTPLPANGKLIYYAGSAWDRAGRVRDEASWTAESQSLASRIAAPMKVRLVLDK